MIIVLAKSTKMCYTYDSLNRVTTRVIKSLADNSVISTENYTYDAAGNMTGDPDNTFQYDVNNRLIAFNGNTVSNDLDGNMVNDGEESYTYDSANRLISYGGRTYTYTSADIRIRNLGECDECDDTTYTYNTNCKLSQLLTKTNCGVTTKYVYGRGLIYEEVDNTAYVYHFDCRGSTVVVTDECGNITDTFEYDTYGHLISRTGTDDIIFLYNGRDGVITDDNGLYYMRARYYSPIMRRFINADIVAGQISNAVTMNRFAYANGNPVSFVDPFGLSAERERMQNALSEDDVAAGIKVIKIGGKYYYDYTAVVMNRLNEVLPDFYNHDILTYTEYIERYSLKLFGKWIISTPGYDEYVASVLGNLWFFYDEVTHGAPWDIKREDPWKQQFGNIRMPAYNDKNKGTETFVFRGQIVTREDLGNMTYGYLGSAMGIGDVTLYWGGGVAAQGLKNIFSDEVRDASVYYGDSKEDHEAIKKGIDFYYEDYPDAKPGINRTIP